jgi:HdeA/HdeB family
MTQTYNKVLWAAIVSSLTISAASVDAQDKGDRTIEQYACKDVMRESGSDRDVAIAFLHGFFVGKSGSSKFNVDILKKQTDLFIDHCLENPSEKALDAMMKVKN